MFLCDMQPGEDDVSFERHLKQLQAEFSKARRNPQIVSDLMLTTYSHRRVEILGQAYCLTKLFERFPFLQELDHVSTQSINKHKYYTIAYYT